MRLIDGDKLKRKTQKVATESWKMKLTAKIETTLNQFIDWIDEAETIDAVPVVRCKECKYWGIHKRLNIPWCREMHIDMGADDFCSMAERITDEAD